MREHLLYASLPAWRRDASRHGWRKATKSNVASASDESCWAARLSSNCLPRPCCGSRSANECVQEKRWLQKRVAHHERVFLGVATLGLGNLLAAGLHGVVVVADRSGVAPERHPGPTIACDDGCGMGRRGGFGRRGLLPAQGLSHP